MKPGLAGVLHSKVHKPERVTFGSLRVSTDRFQVRNASALAFVPGLLKRQESEELATSLLATARAGGTLDPPIVWADDKGSLWVIDGHHRTAALQEAGTAAKARVWVQRFEGTESEARAYALETNVKPHMNMAAGEVLNAYWRALLCGEVVGSINGRAAKHRVSRSTVQRMDKQKPAVLAELKAAAKEAHRRYGTHFILANAPSWKDCGGKWRDSAQQAPTDDRERAAVERLLKAFTGRFAKEAKARPDVLLRAFEEFFNGATGRDISIRRNVPQDDDSEF